MGLLLSLTSFSRLLCFQISFSVCVVSRGVSRLEHHLCFCSVKLNGVGVSYWFIILLIIICCVQIISCVIFLGTVFLFIFQVILFFYSSVKLLMLLVLVV